MSKENKLELFFSAFRTNTIGYQQVFTSPFGKMPIVYSDWTASGKAYRPIEEYLQKKIMPFVANTHTGTTVTGTLMSGAYEKAKSIVKAHVNANTEDALIFCGSGMTAAVNKLQRILGFRMPEQMANYLKSEFPQMDKVLRPIVFVTHMEHHSNHITWLETIATVEIINADKNGNVDMEHFRILLEQYKNRKNKIAAITGCSNVTGIQTPYYKIAKLIHEYNGLCFVDFACSAPYIDINMHPEGKDEHLDAIYFSPHKFLGGPGTPGVLIFNKKVYKNRIPDQPGGGTVSYTNPWGFHEYSADIEQREDGGTHPFLQGIKVAMCIRLKEKMGVKNILKREAEILKIVFEKLSAIKNVTILENNNKHRLCVISFIIDGAHYNLVVKILNDRYGIQARGGCSCAGTYGHKLLDINKTRSYEILNLIRSGDLSYKPGWIRISMHPIMTNKEINFIMGAIQMTALHFPQWMKDYTYDRKTNEYSFKGLTPKEPQMIETWFDASGWK